ncbi:MAG TPA: TolC family protein [Acidobacteriota bacterium]|nr:TolC family protein [Acidobacteriota bacterium]
MSTPAASFHSGRCAPGSCRLGIGKRFRDVWRILLLTCFVATAGAQQKSQSLPDLSKNPEWFPRVYKPYQAKEIPQIDLANSAGLFQLIHDGKLQISLKQLKTAVSENNLDILSSSNSARYAQTDLLRVKGGGAPRGGAGVTIPTSLFSGAIGAGVGGVGGLGGFGGAGGITSGASQVFGVSRGSYDPSLSLGFSIDATTSPLNSIIVAGVPEVTTHSTALQSRYSQAFTSGSSLSVSFNNMRQSSTQRFLLYNPDFVSRLSISLTQQLLSGFGTSIGRRFLEVARNEEKIMQEVVRLQINTTLAQAQSTYWDLVAARENVRVAEQSLAVAVRLRDENKEREDIGTASGLDVVTADSEVAARQRDLAEAQAAMQMREVELKDQISKNLAGLLNSVRIEPTDALPEPKDADIPKLDDALAAAFNNRSEIKQAETNLLTQDIAVRYEKDLLRPTLLVFANFNSSGLYGNQALTDAFGNTIVLPGGMSQAMRQVRNWTYPEYAVGFSFSLTIHNRAAKADLYRARLEKQQTETSLQRTRNSVALEIRKAMIGLIQSRAQVQAAHKAVQLSRESLAAEETKLIEGSSIPYEVIRRQRDLSSAQFAEIQALAAYAKALVERDRSMGVISN